MFSLIYWQTEGQNVMSLFKRCMYISELFTIKCRNLRRWLVISVFVVCVWQKGFDVFNALDLMENKVFLEKLKFGIGDGNLQYYLYNWKCPPMDPDKVSGILIMVNICTFMIYSLPRCLNVLVVLFIYSFARFPISLPFVFASSSFLPSSSFSASSFVVFHILFSCLIYFPSLSLFLASFRPPPVGLANSDSLWTLVFYVINWTQKLKLVMH